MSKVSRRVLGKDLENYIFDLFINSVTELNKTTDVQNFLEDLLSPSEKMMLIKRLAIAILLTKGYTYDEIDQTLKVSRPTIMTVSYFLNHGQNGGYQKVVQKIISNQRKAALFDKIEEILLQLSPRKLYGSGAYERKRRLGQELYKRKTVRENL